MAVIQMDFMSGALQRWTTAQILLPEDVKKGEKLKTLILLHGNGGNHTDWLNYSNIARYVRPYPLAVILPDGDNSYYLNFPERGEYYEEFIAKELPELMGCTFPLSDKREDTFIAGLSMGGGAAIRMGLRRGDVFSKAAGLSSGLTVQAEARMVGHGSDIYAAYEEGKQKEPPYEMARLFLSIGEEDPLLHINRRFHTFLEKEGVDHVYEEHPGAHNWDFWDGHIRDVLAFLMPEEKEGR
ncbi:MAG: acetylesterase [Lachnospiraceae bacterium]|nr:acetylesterase [Lachnospiraceae bacterium]